MPNFLSNEAFLPCLLDRLCDDNPLNKTETHSRGSLTMNQFRQNVLRDLGWLFNTSAHVLNDGFEQYPDVESSVLNYGTPDLCGRTTSSLNFHQLESQLTESIIRFEPRILPRSISVKAIPGIKKCSPNTIGIEIRGLLWANPMPEEFILESQLDLETGQCVSDLFRNHKTV